MKVLKTLSILSLFVIGSISCENKASVKVERVYGPKLIEIKQDGNRSYEVYHPTDSVIEFEKIYLNEQLDSVTEWGNDGVLWFQTDYKYGLRHGKHIGYDPKGSGKILYIYHYENGELVDREIPSTTYSLNQSVYLHGVPPAPPFKSIDLTIKENREQGCNAGSVKLIGYIIEVEKLRYDKFDFIFQDFNGVQETCHIDGNLMSNADVSWLPTILIPGNKVEMKVQYCGSSGYIDVMKIKSLFREN